MNETQITKTLAPDDPISTTGVMLGFMEHLALALYKKKILTKDEVTDVYAKAVEVADRITVGEGILTREDMNDILGEMVDRLTAYPVEPASRA